MGRYPNRNVTFVNSSGSGMTYKPAVRRAPRIRLNRQDGQWRATWVAQNDSFLYCCADTRRAAVWNVIRWAWDQRWPLFTAGA